MRAFFLWGIVIFLQISASLGGPLDNWHWRNPTPFANSLRSSCFGAGKFVAVGDGGVIHTSLDGLIWDEGQRPVHSTLRKVVFTNGSFTAVGDDGVIINSPDGYEWASRNSGTTNDLYSIAYGNGLYLACGQGGRLTISSDGANWHASSIGTDDLNWVTFGKGDFVVAGPNASMAVRVSSDGVTWSMQTLPQGTGFEFPSSLHAAVYANGLFIASVDGEVERAPGFYFSIIQFVTSSDATNWTKGTPYASGGLDHRFLTAANGVFYDFSVSPDSRLGTYNYLAATTDGVTVVTTQISSEALDATSLTYGEGKNVVTALGGKIWTQSGTNWYPIYGGVRSNLTTLIHGPDRYLAVGSGPAPMLTSHDGIRFDPLPGSPLLSYGDVEVQGSNYVAVATAGMLYISKDGISWTQQNSNTKSDLLALCYGTNRWVAVGRNGTVITSPNGLAWSLRGSGTVNNLKSVAYGNGNYVAVGDDGVIISSTDSATWDVQLSGSLSTLNCVRFLNGEFVSVGANGTILNSTNGVDWSAQSSPVATTLNGVAFGNGRFVACGADGSVLQSTNAIDWEDISKKVPAGVGLNSVAYLTGSFWLCGENGAILQSDSVDGIPRLTGTMLSDGSGFEVKVILNAPPVYRIQTASNLFQNSWRDVAVITNGPGATVWTDSDATAAALRFYRTASP